jgi:hypothetical protein
LQTARFPPDELDLFFGRKTAGLLVMTVPDLADHFHRFNGHVWSPPGENKYYSITGTNTIPFAIHHGLHYYHLRPEKETEMKFHLPLENMTTADKLAAMEELWEDLSRDPKAVPSPDWHQDVLKARERKVTQGTAHFSPLAEVKDRIRKSPK